VTLRLLGIVLGLAIALRVALPFALEMALERAGDRLKSGYSVVLVDIDLALWRGVFRFDGVRVDQATEGRTRPVFEVDDLEVSLRWAGLLKGEILLEVEVLRPRWTMVAAPPASDRALEQTGIPFVERLHEVAPFRIDRLEVREGELHFLDPHRRPEVDVELTSIELDLRNFGNLVDTDARRPAKGLLRARSPGGGRIALALDADPLARAPDFAVAARLEQMDLREVNDFFGAYGRFDVEQGKLSVFSEIDARSGRFQGYVRPVIEELDVVDAEEPDESPWSLAWEAFVGAVAELLQNQPTERQATQIPVQGAFASPNLGLWTAVVTTLRNAFVEALPPQFERGGRLSRDG